MNGQTDRPDVEADDELQPVEATEAPEPKVENEGEESESTLEQLQAKVDENWDRYLRASAEMENVRKRARRDVEQAHKFALENFSRDLLA